MKTKTLSKGDDPTLTKEDAFQTLTLINSWIGNVDTKTSFALAIIGVLIGLTFSNGFSNVITLATVLISNVGFKTIISVLLVVLLYAATLISMFCFIWALIARVKNPDNKKDVKEQSLFFFGSISNINRKRIDTESGRTNTYKF